MTIVDQRVLSAKRSRAQIAFGNIVIETESGCDERFT